MLRKLLLATLQIATIALFVTSSLAAQPITRSEVEQLLERMEEAARDRDVVAIGATLADDAEIRFIVNSEHGQETLNFDRMEYLLVIAAVLEDLQDYRLTMTVDDIRIEPGGEQAMVQLTVRENLSWKDRSQSGVTREAITIVRIDGELRVTRIMGVTEIHDLGDGVQMTNRRQYQSKLTG